MVTGCRAKEEDGEGDDQGKCDGDEVETSGNDEGYEATIRVRIRREIG